MFNSERVGLDLVKTPHSRLRSPVLGMPGVLGDGSAWRSGPPPNEYGQYQLSWFAEM